MNTHTPNIFVVEDDKFFAQMIKETLGKHFFKNVQIFQSGEDCLDRIHETPDLVILDYGLGTMNGLDVLRQIKSINPNIQVIFLSAQEKMDVAINSLKYGAFDYLEKTDASLQRMVHQVRKILNLNKIMAENSRYATLSKGFFVTTAVLMAIIAHFYLR